MIKKKDVMKFKYSKTINLKSYSLLIYRTAFIAAIIAHWKPNIAKDAKGTLSHKLDAYANLIIIAFGLITALAKKTTLLL